MLFGLVVLSLRKREAGAHHAAWLKTRIDLADAGEAFQEKARSREKDEAEGEFSCDEERAEPLACPARGRRAARFA